MKTLNNSTRKLIEDINNLIEFCALHDITAINTDSTWEAEYIYQPIVINKKSIRVVYSELYPKKIIKETISFNDFDLLTFLRLIRKELKKGIRAADIDEIELIIFLSGQ